MKLDGEASKVGRPVVDAVSSPEGESKASALNGEQAPKRRPGRPRLDGPSAEFVARRAEIVAVAADVFREKGYDAGTLDDVGEALGLRRASLYYYVRSKPYLLYLIFQRAFDLVLDDVQRHLHIEDPAERLETIIRYQARTIASEPSLFSVLFDHRPRLDAMFEEEIRHGERRVFRAYCSAVQAAVEAGVLSDLDPLYATHAIMGMTTWAYKWFDPGHHDIEQFADTCVLLVFTTLGVSRQVDMVDVDLSPHSARMQTSGPGLKALSPP